MKANDRQAAIDLIIQLGGRTASCGSLWVINELGWYERKVCGRGNLHAAGSIRVDPSKVSFNCKRNRVTADGRFFCRACMDLVFAWKNES